MQNGSLENKVTALNKVIDDHKNNILHLNQKSKNLSAELEQSERVRQQLKQDIETLNLKIVDLEESLYESKQIQLDLLDQLQQVEGNLEGAQDKIRELLELNSMLEKDLPIYIPKKYSQIDIALSNFINDYPERDSLKILFLRESEGVYRFGSRRVYIKIGKNKQILVRVGGGFVGIKDFLQQFTPLETEKL